MVCLDTFKLQTMTALIKSFYGGVQGGQFFQKAPPLAAGGRTEADCKPGSVEKNHLSGQLIA